MDYNQFVVATIHETAICEDRLLSHLAARWGKTTGKNPIMLARENTGLKMMATLFAVVLSSIFVGMLLRYQTAPAFLSLAVITLLIFTVGLVGQSVVSAKNKRDIVLFLEHYNLVVEFLGIDNTCRLSDAELEHRALTRLLSIAGETHAASLTNSAHRKKVAAAMEDNLDMTMVVLKKFHLGRGPGLLYADQVQELVSGMKSHSIVGS